MQDNPDPGNREMITSTAISGPADVAGLIAKWKMIITSPKDFFATMPVDGGMQEPVTFYAAISGVFAVGVLLIGIMNPLQSVGQAIFALILMMAGSFICAAINFGLSKLFGGTGSYEATYRAYSYANAPGILAWIPIIGAFTGLYSLYLLKLGLERSQGLTSSKAIAVIAIQVGIAIVLGVTALMLGAAVIFAGAHH
jgi:hypothetical protein